MTTFKALDAVRIKPELAGEYWARNIADQRGVVLRMEGDKVRVRFRGINGAETVLDVDMIEATP